MLGIFKNVCGVVGGGKTHNFKQLVQMEACAELILVLS